MNKIEKIEKSVHLSIASDENISTGNLKKIRRPLRGNTLRAHTKDSKRKINRGLSNNSWNTAGEQHEADQPLDQRIDQLSHLNDALNHLICELRQDTSKGKGKPPLKDKKKKLSNISSDSGLGVPLKKNNFHSISMRWGVKPLPEISEHESYLDSDQDMEPDPQSFNVAFKSITPNIDEGSKRFESDTPNMKVLKKNHIKRERVATFGRNELSNLNSILSNVSFQVGEAFVNRVQKEI